MKPGISAESAPSAWQQRRGESKHHHDPTYPLDAMELTALGAILNWKCARDYLASIPLGTAVFTDGVASALAGSVLSGPVSLPRDWPERTVDRAYLLVDWADSHTPTTNEHAVLAVRVFVQCRAAPLLPTTCRWAADALDRRWCAIAEVARQLRTVFDLALEGRAA